MIHGGCCETLKSQVVLGQLATLLARIGCSDRAQQLLDEFLKNQSSGPVVVGPAYFNPGETNPCW